MADISLSLDRPPLIDCCRFAGVARFEELFPYMPGDWRRHFDRYEWTGAVDTASNHIRVSHKFRHDAVPAFVPEDLAGRHSLVVSHQALAVNGWADTVGAGVFLDAMIAYSMEHWTSATNKVALVVSPHNPVLAASQIRQHGGNPAVAAVSLPLTGILMGSVQWDPVYQACVDLDLPVVIHFSGVEGSYLGAAPLSGASHTNPLSRLILMPHLAESNTASLVFEGTFYRFPTLRVLFAGFGFRWLPSLLRRMDQEWRNFRSDMPWVKDKPSTKVLSNIWVSSYPVGEATNPEHWIGEFTESLLDRIVFTSNAPFDTDGLAEVRATLGDARVGRMMNSGAAFLRLDATVDA